MASSSKVSVSRRKSAGGKGITVTLHVSPEKLKEIVQPTTKEASPPVKEQSETRDQEDAIEANETINSPGNSTPAPPSAPANGENASDSNADTPTATANGTPVPTSMGPPADGSKKKGVKRSAGAANGLGPDGQPKVRGKPGPKKKARLEDGTIDPSGGGRGGAAAHKLGPKANQGAINAGLRALDRSGAPCRKWARGGFTMKSFTGVVWEVPRWTAPPKIISQSPSDDSVAASVDNSSKENQQNGDTKETNSQLKSDVNSAVANSTAGVDVPSGPGSAIAASSPAPMAISAA